ncbi:hypothetical protein BC628DRAFT_572560 [Trametes gibbosa]|nr:hypothetical protein BC628DRAFT_572560 [Trametes gibbosa]
MPIASSGAAVYMNSGGTDPSRQLRLFTGEVANTLKLSIKYQEELHAFQKVSSSSEYMSYVSADSMFKFVTDLDPMWWRILIVQQASMYRVLTQQDEIMQGITELKGEVQGLNEKAAKNFVFDKEMEGNAVTLSWLEIVKGSQEDYEDIADVVMMRLKDVNIYPNFKDIWKSMSKKKVVTTGVRNAATKVPLTAAIRLIEKSSAVRTFTTEMVLRVVILVTPSGLQRLDFPDDPLSIIPQRRAPEPRSASPRSPGGLVNHDLASFAADARFYFSAPTQTTISHSQAHRSPSPPSVPHSPSPSFSTFDPPLSPAAGHTASRSWSPTSSSPSQPTASIFPAPGEHVFIATHPASPAYASRDYPTRHTATPSVYDTEMLPSTRPVVTPRRPQRSTGLSMLLNSDGFQHVASQGPAIVRPPMPHGVPFHPSSALPRSTPASHAHTTQTCPRHVLSTPASISASSSAMQGYVLHGSFHYSHNTASPFERD